jgi:hypothetical protein
MDEQGNPRWTWLDWKLVGLLAVLALGIRAWQLTHTEVAARDSIGYIRYAWQFHQASVAEWPAVLKGADQHPLYPLWVLAVARVLGPHFSGSTASLMQLSAQVASTIAAVLLVLPLFALGRRLFDRRVGFFTALLVQCLPVSGRILADGLSEATFLLLATSALSWGVVALNEPRRPGAFALTGVFSALAYLTRPEGAFIVAATGIMLLVGQAVPGWRRSWREVVRCGAALAVPALLLASPLVLSTGSLTLKPTGKLVSQQLVERRPAASGPLFAVWDVDGVMEVTKSRGLWGVRALAAELGKGSFYFGWIPVGLGLWWYRRFWRQPGVWMLFLVCATIGYALWRVVVVVGYLSDRHTLLIQTCFIPWGMAGLAGIGLRLAQRWPRLGKAPLLVPLAFTLAGLPKTLEPLHNLRTGFRDAGVWLAEHADPTDKITDPLCWSHYYAGRVFLEHTDSKVPPGHRRLEYIVIEETDNSHPRIQAYQEALAKVHDREPVHRCAVKRGKKHAEILIYAVPLTSDS